MRCVINSLPFWALKRTVRWSNLSVVTQVSLLQSPSNFCLFEQIRLLNVPDFAAIAFITMFHCSLSPPSSVAGFYMDEALLTSPVLPQTSTFLHISGSWSEGGGLLSSGEVMRHRDKQWSDSWIWCFFFFQPAFCSQQLCFCRHKNGRTCFERNGGETASEGLSQGLSQQRIMKACRLCQNRLTTFSHVSVWPIEEACRAESAVRR